MVLSESYNVVFLGCSHHASLTANRRADSNASRRTATEYSHSEGADRSKHWTELNLNSNDVIVARLCAFLMYNIFLFLLFTLFSQATMCGRFNKGKKTVKIFETSPCSIKNLYVYIFQKFKNFWNNFQYFR